MSASNDRPSSFRKLSGEENSRKEKLSLMKQMSARNQVDDDDSDESFNNPEPDDDDDDVQAPVPDGFYDPDFIPAIGDIDAFIKIPRPDGKPSDVGLTVLDEPCTQQSDPAVLQLQLRAATKQTSAKRVIVKKVDNAVKNYKAIDRWIKDINNLHKSKPSSSLVYSKPMPDIDALMQEWPAEFEEQLSTLGLSKDLNCDLQTYADIVCALTDIPVYKSRIESLHLLFSLYAAVKSLQIKADPATTNVLAS